MKNWLETLLEGAETPRDGGERHGTEETVRRDPLRSEAEWDRWPALRPDPVPLPEEASAPAAEPAGYRRVPPADPAAPPLTVEAVDRAVRRDSRRYDGGMSIY